MLSLEQMNIYDVLLLVVEKGLLLRVLQPLALPSSSPGVPEPEGTEMWVAGGLCSPLQLRG